MSWNDYIRDRLSKLALLENRYPITRRALTKILAICAGVAAVGKPFAVDLEAQACGNLCNEPPQFEYECTPTTDYCGGQQCWNESGWSCCDYVCAPIYDPNHGYECAKAFYVPPL